MPETKKDGKESENLTNYLHIWSGVHKPKKRSIRCVYLNQQETQATSKPFSLNLIKLYH